MSDEPRPAGDTDPPIKVTDHRSFHPDGERRRDVPEAGEQASVADAPPEDAPTAAVAGESGPAASPEAAPAREDAAPAAAKPTAMPGETADGVDFQQFVYFLYMSSLHEMGVPTEPGAPARAPNLDRARFFIDVLQILKTKTAGNLDAGEDKLLEEILYNLQMQYVAGTGKPTP